jgi:outer membrane protein assembly factor BamB
MAATRRRSRGRCIRFSTAWWILTLANLAAAEGIDRLDWPNWRGPQQNRVSTEKGLIESWDPDGGPGSNLLWKSDALAGRSTPIVLGGKLYTIVRDQPNSPNEGEKVVCADAATGDILWEHRFNVYLSEVPADRVGWSNCVADPQTGRIYAQGVCGYFCCLEGDTGKVVWDRSLHEEFGLISTYGGRTNTPVIFEDTVLISAVIVGWGDEPKWGNLARPAHRFLCFDKATGELRWMNGTSISPYETTYSTPTVLPIGGQAALVFSSGDGGVWALQPRTGQHIWHYPFARWGFNGSPLVTADGRVFAGHAVENTIGNTMGSVVALDGTKSGDLTGTELWRQFEKMAGYSSPVMLDERLYVVDDGAKLFVFDAKTGEQIARKALGSSMRSTPLVADGKIYLCTFSGQWYVLKPTEDGVEVVHKLRLRNEENDASPIVSHGRIYLPTSENLYCLGTPDHKPQADPLPEWPEEDPLSSYPVPAQLQVVPYDATLRPGEKLHYQVRVFNSRGQLLKEDLATRASFDVDGPGKVTLDGTYHAPDGAGHQCALITCKVGKLTSAARVRIVPPLPWKFDFNDGQNVPLTWLGGRIRWEPREASGERFIAKRTVLPTPKNPNNKLGTRSYLWMGPAKLSNYTIQADVALKEDNGRMSDVGLIASGYELMIRSVSGTLRLDSWASNDYRTFAQSAFRPKPDTWYTMKLMVAADQKQATVRGKIWPRNEAEPEDWTIELLDQSPNVKGTPGVFGNSPDAEIYLDNLQVTSN